MVGSTGTLMTMRLVRSKLRKREESSPASPVTIEAQQPDFASQAQRSTNSVNSYSNRENSDQQIFTTSSLSNTNNLNSNNIQIEQEHVTFVRTSGVGSATNEEHQIFPPKVPTPNIYNCINNHAVMAANDKNGFKGLRKQFSGRFKRLVAKKSEPAPAIPPELKPQLKTIYVY